MPLRIGIADLFSLLTHYPGRFSGPKTVRHRKKKTHTQQEVLSFVCSEWCERVRVDSDKHCAQSGLSRGRVPKDIPFFQKEHLIKGRSNGSEGYPDTLKYSGQQPRLPGCFPLGQRESCCKSTALAILLSHYIKCFEPASPLGYHKNLPTP